MDGKGSQHGQLNGVFTQASNRRHQRSGHLFQGRYKGILVDADAYLMELARYIVLNPVRAGMVDTPGAWPWSSYEATAGEAPSPQWLATDDLLTQFGSRRKKARRRYAKFVAAGIDRESVWKDLNRQVFLGDDQFVTRMQQHLKGQPEDINVPKAQRRTPAPPLRTIADSHSNRNQAIVAAYATGEYSYSQIAEFFRLHFTTVGKIVRGRRNKGS